MNAVLGAAYARHPGREKRFVLEEVQVPPGLRLGVLDLTALRSALRARESGALVKVDTQLQATLLVIKVAVHNTPWRHEPQRLPKEIDITHPVILADAPSAHPSEVAVTVHRLKPAPTSDHAPRVAAGLTRRPATADGSIRSRRGRDQDKSTSSALPTRSSEGPARQIDGNSPAVV